MGIRIAFALNNAGEFEKKHFIPVQVKEEAPEKVKTILLKHMRWLQDELNNNSEEYKMFVMDSGILKTAVQKERF